MATRWQRADFDAANYTIDSDYTPISTAPNTGLTTVVFNISDELVTRGQANGYLIGGCVPTGGIGGADPDCTSYNDGATPGHHYLPHHRAGRI